MPRAFCFLKIFNKTSISTCLLVVLQNFANPAVHLQDSYQIFIQILFPFELYTSWKIVSGIFTCWVLHKNFWNTSTPEGASYFCRAIFVNIVQIYTEEVHSLPFLHIHVLQQQNFKHVFGSQWQYSDKSFKRTSSKVLIEL
jgi:hypothetical protein